MQSCQARTQTIRSKCSEAGGKGFSKGWVKQPGSAVLLCPFHRPCPQCLLTHSLLEAPGAAAPSSDPLEELSRNSQAQLLQGQSRVNPTQTAQGTPRIPHRGLGWEIRGEILLLKYLNNVRVSQPRDARQNPPVATFLRFPFI